ncbi:MAG: LPS assembly lipoprotein LptE [Bacteroidales bacterium]|nr:LPS assembly lipoprotein LptE [Bacteroidales bacterium]
MISNKRIILFFFGLFAATLISCYSFHGASIPPNIRSFSVDMFQNRATMVNPVLSLEVTDGLVNFIMSRSNLVEVNQAGDIEVSGEITAYTLTPMAAGADAQAAMQRFSITIRVNFSNNVTPADSFSQSFTVFRDFDSSIDFASVEENLMREIVEQLVNDVFMRAFGQW